MTHPATPHLGSRLIRDALYGGWQICGQRQFEVQLVQTAGKHAPDHHWHNGFVARDLLALLPTRPRI